MNLELTKDKIYQILKRKHQIIDKKKLISNIKKTYLRTLSFLEPLISKKITGYERDDNLGNINPLIWEFGHVVYFWEHKTIRLLSEANNIKNCMLEGSENLYNSHIVSREERYENKYKLNTILKTYRNIIEYIIKFIQKPPDEYNSISCYLIMISLLHNEMHNESFLFSSQLLNLERPGILKEYITKNNQDPHSIEFITINGHGFRQGTDRDTHNFTFDNEMPSFSVDVKNFKVSKYPITQYQYMKFVESNGYNNKNYWCQQGWRWVRENNINHPIYWKKINNNWMIKKFGKYYPLINNIPVYHISWYEANAFCRWAGYRLPSESEWEFLATNGGTSLYPWGNRKISQELCNIDYVYDGPVEVNKYMAGNNLQGVSQLFGNVWEWCAEPIYPYNGFIIDPVYREMSYPFFGFKRICRGGCWAVPNFLINSKYRNAQMPDCRMQFIGFRVCL